jgi:hypothetical protein
VAAYTFGNKLKGTLMTPESKLRIVPSAGLKLQIKHIQAYAGIEYMKSVFFKVGPIWLRTGISYNFYLSKIRSPGKVRKIYGPFMFSVNLFWKMRFVKPPVDTEPTATLS